MGGPKTIEADALYLNGDAQYLSTSIPEGAANWLARADAMLEELRLRWRAHKALGYETGCAEVAFIGGVLRATRDRVAAKFGL